VQEMISSAACVMLNRDPINHWWISPHTPYFRLRKLADVSCKALLEVEDTL